MIFKVYLGAALVTLLPCWRLDGFGQIIKMSASGLKLLNEGETNEAEGKMKSIS